MSYQIKILGGSKNPAVMRTVRDSAIRDAGLQVEGTRDMETGKTVYAVSTGDQIGKEALESIIDKLGLPAEYGVVSKVKYYPTIGGAVGALRSYTESEDNPQK